MSAYLVSEHPPGSGGRRVHAAVSGVGVDDLIITLFVEADPQARQRFADHLEQERQAKLVASVAAAPVVQTTDPSAPAASPEANHRPTRFRGSGDLARSAARPYHPPMDGDIPEELAEIKEILVAIIREANRRGADEIVDLAERATLAAERLVAQKKGPSP